VNEHAEAGLTPPGHARVALRGGLCVLNRSHGVIAVDCDVFSLNLCGRWKRIRDEQKKDDGKRAAIDLQETSWWESDGARIIYEMIYLPVELQNKPQNRV
jgi:hypothetical protein